MQTTINSSIFSHLSLSKINKSVSLNKKNTGDIKVPAVEETSICSLDCKLTLSLSHLRGHICHPATETAARPSPKP